MAQVKSLVGFFQRAPAIKQRHGNHSKMKSSHNDREGKVSEHGDRQPERDSIARISALLFLFQDLFVMNALIPKSTP